MPRSERKPTEQDLDVSRPDPWRSGRSTVARGESDERPANVVRRRVARPLAGLRARSLELRKELGIFRRLFVRANGRLWFLPAMAALALLSSLFEGASLTLIIPLVQTLGGGGTSAPGGFLLGPLNAAIEAIDPQSRMVVILALIVCAVVAKGAISYANMVLLVGVYGRLSHALRVGVFARIVERPLAKIEREPSGKLLNVLNNETWRATDALNHVFTMITSVATMLVFITLLMLLSWQLSLLAVLCMAVVPPFIQIIARRAKAIGHRGLEANEALSQRAWTALNGLRTIHAFGREKFEIDRFGERSDATRRLFLKMALVSMTTGPLAEVLVIGIVAGLALMVNQSGLTAGTLVGFLAILYRLQPHLLSFISAQASLFGLHASVAAVNEALEWRTEPIKASRRQRAFPGVRESLSFDGVGFTYPGAPRPALDAVSFDARPGVVTTLAGASGAGKSTLLDLILRFREPTRGVIRADGMEVGEYDLASWRSRIAVVSQDPYVFDDTIRANILYGRLEATEAEMVEAARIACADEFIRDMPRGYDTVVGERGARISGGQRQRIALARALLRRSDILILDEATNALDELTERAFQEALRRFSADRIVIVVAHRLATIERSHNVIVLDAGQLVEQGAPAALLSSGGHFARMFGRALAEPIHPAKPREFAR